MATSLPPSRYPTAVEMRIATGLTLFVGLWFIISAWVLGVNDFAGAIWNNVIVGILIAVFAGAVSQSGMRVGWAAWCDLALGIWVFFSPWIYGYTLDRPRFVNSLCVGVAVVLLSLWIVGVQSRRAARA